MNHVEDHLLFVRNTQGDESCIEGKMIQGLVATGKPELGPNLSKPRWQSCCECAQFPSRLLQLHFKQIYQSPQI